MSSLIHNPFAFDKSADYISSPVTNLELSESNKDILVKDLPKENEFEVYVPQTVQVTKVRRFTSNLIVHSGSSIMNEQWHYYEH